MKRYINICLVLVITLILTIGCNKDNLLYDKESNSSASNSVVELLEDGTLKVSASISATEQTPIETRATSTLSPDNIIYTGWCMVFGVDKNLYTVTTGEDGTQIIKDKDGKEVEDGYGPNSPLLQKTRIIANTNGRFYMTFKPTAERVFMRIIANVSAREEENYKGAIAESNIAENDKITKAATFGQFIEQSIGLDGIYNFNFNGKANIDYDYSTGIGTGKITYTKNTISPDPSKLQRAFPMSSHGYVLKNGITAESISSMFNEKIKMVRIFSKIVVFAKEDSNFKIEEVTLLKGANESRVRSTLLSSISSDVKEIYTVPEDLGGAVQYEPIGAKNNGSESEPIYLYPNSGGDYANEKGEVNKDINPTYLVIKGKADGYSNPGYYKVALKATYPLTYDSNGKPTSYTALTYDIIRDNFFHINLQKIDKPGYATFEEAADPGNPANNISYSIVINGEDNRNEYLVSNGTYYVELKTSRVYAKGYNGKEVRGSIDMSLDPTIGHQHPNIHIYGENGVKITSVSEATDGNLDGINTKFIKASNESKNVSIEYSATQTGRICIRCGDILKYIPIVYDTTPLLSTGASQLSISDGKGSSWNNFAYSDIYYTEANPLLELNDNGKIAANKEYKARSFEARIFPKDGSGFTQLFVKQASNFIMWDNNRSAEAQNIEVVYDSKGNKVSSTNNSIIPSKGSKYSYEIKGDKDDVTLVSSGNFNNFNADPKTIALNTPFTFEVINIGTNNGDPTLKDSVTIDLVNSANEKKEYTFKITQYAAPSADSKFEEEVKGGIKFITPKPTNTSKLPLLNAYTGRYFDWGYKYPLEDYGETLEEVEVYNCYYKSSETGLITDNDGNQWGWKWEEVPEEIAESSKYGSASEQLNKVKAAFSIGHSIKYIESTDKVYGDYGTHTFPITMNKFGNSDYYKDKYSCASAFFVLIVRNKVGEKCETRMLIQCKAS